MRGNLHGGFDRPRGRDGLVSEREIILIFFSVELRRCVRESHLEAIARPTCLEDWRVRSEEWVVKVISH